MALTAVIKLGGEVIASPALATVTTDVGALVADGWRVAIVHGGGPQANALSTRLGLEVRQVGGRRITDAATLDVIKMVVAGQLNVDLCAALAAAGLSPVGLHGASGRMIRASKRPPRVVSGGGPDPIDFGYVGDVTGYNLPLLELLFRDGYTPVLACLGADDAGGVFNINADIVGNQLAGHLRADHMLLVTDVPGVLRDLDDPSSRLPLLTVAEARDAIAGGVVTGGMIPKIEEAIAVLGEGAKAIHIVGQLSPGDLARAVREPGAVGTTLVP